jgi:hypothetical protein
MWDFLCDLAWTAAIIDVASMTYYAWQWYGGPVAAAKGLWANGPEVVPLLTMGALAPIKVCGMIYSRKDLQVNFDKIEQHIKMKTFEEDVSQWKSGDPVIPTDKEPGQLAQSYTALDASNFLPTNDWLASQSPQETTPTIVTRPCTPPIVVASSSSSGSFAPVCVGGFASVSETSSESTSGSESSEEALQPEEQ